MEEPHEEHMAAVKHVLRYISRTRTCGVFYPRKKEVADCWDTLIVIWQGIWTAGKALWCAVFLG
jgi:hypothetical protein